MTDIAANRKRPHWSASQFMLFEQCPQLYRMRYVDGLAAEPSVPMAFGSVVHKGLEFLLQPRPSGGLTLERLVAERAWRDGRRAYTTAFDEVIAPLIEDRRVQADMFSIGLNMLLAVDKLALNADGRSIPERWMTLPADVTHAFRPTVGAADLWAPPWSQHGAAIFDFKTTAGKWSQERALTERWQPLLYSWGYLRAYDRIPAFKYVVLSRIDGSLNIFERTWPTIRAWQDEQRELWASMVEIAQRITDGDFDCARGQHGPCLECGEVFSHTHVCPAIPRHLVTLTRHVA